VPRLVHYGFVADRNASWSGTGDAPISYDDAGASRAVTVPVPAEWSAGTLAFTLYGDTNSNVVPASHWGLVQYIPLDRNTTGTLVVPAVMNAASPPGGNACYQVDATALGGGVFPGRVVGIQFGFTTSTNPATAIWNDGSGHSVQAGQIDAMFTSDSAPMTLDVVRVPTGSNLLLRVTYAEWTAPCGDTTGVPSMHTQTFVQLVP
jgi:hypothetical protein